MFNNCKQETGATKHNDEITIRNSTVVAVSADSLGELYVTVASNGVSHLDIFWQAGSRLNYHSV